MSLNRDREQEQNPEPTGKFGEMLRDFRAAVTYVALRETAAPMRDSNWLAAARHRRRRHQQRVVLGWACAVLLCAATLPLATHSHGPATLPVEHTTATAVVDSTPESGLLEQVDADVSESVPSSLAPLAEMDTLNPANSTSDSSPDGTTLSTENKNAGR